MTYNARPFAISSAAPLNPSQIPDLEISLMIYLNVDVLVMSFSILSSNEFFVS